MQRTTVAHLIERHLAGELTLPLLAQWALQAFHALTANADDEDENDDIDDIDDDDENEPVIAADPTIVTILDTLMFADQPEFTPTTAEFAEILGTLRA
jgi:hypothetical protein